MRNETIYKPKYVYSDQKDCYVRVYRNYYRYLHMLSLIQLDKLKLKITLHVAEHFRQYLYVTSSPPVASCSQKCPRTCLKIARHLHYLYAYRSYAVRENISVYCFPFNSMMKPSKNLFGGFLQCNRLVGLQRKDLCQ